MAKEPPPQPSPTRGEGACRRSPLYARRVAVAPRPPLEDNPRKRKDGTMDYQVDLEVFHGPLDLLLYLVKREELDLMDIPIARVTEQYVAYLDVLKEIDVEK